MTGTFLTQNFSACIEFRYGDLNAQNPMSDPVVEDRVLQLLRAVDRHVDDKKREGIVLDPPGRPPTMRFGVDIVYGSPVVGSPKVVFDGPRFETHGNIDASDLLLATEVALASACHQESGIKPHAIRVVVRCEWRVEE